MKYLVTGGAGFLGSHLIDELLNNGHEVKCFDNFSTGKEINLKYNKSKIEIIKGDIRDPFAVSNALRGVEFVFHLAAQISVNRSIHEPIYDADVNINGMINLLEAIRKSDVSKILYVSTGGAIYGEPNHIPVSETTEEKPISPYGLSKLIGEKYLELYKRNYNINYTIIRPSNIYGPRQDPLGEAGVISIFLGNLKSNKPLNIYGDGKDTRDYIYVKDVVNICIKAIESPYIDIFNAGTEKQTNLIELVDIIESVAKITGNKVFNPPRPGDVKHIALDINKGKHLLKWEPSIDLRSGIEETWDWFNSG